MNATGEQSLLVCGFSHYNSMSLLVDGSSSSAPVVSLTLVFATGELKYSVNKTLEAFEELLHVYKSGQHLQNLPSSVIKGKTVLNVILLYHPLNSSYPLFYSRKPAGSRRVACR